RSYTEAQQQVDAAEMQLQKGQVRLVLRDGEQDRAVEELARALVTRGQPRSNPFAAFGDSAPSAIKDLNPAAKAKTIHQLVAAVQRQKPITKSLSLAAERAEHAAEKTEAVALAVGKFHAALQNSRQARDDIGQNWDKSLAGLKR